MASRTDDTDSRLVGTLSIGEPWEAPTERMPVRVAGVGVSPSLEPVFLELLEPEMWAEPYRGRWAVVKCRYQGEDMRSATERVVSGYVISFAGGSGPLIGWLRLERSIDDALTEVW